MKNLLPFNYLIFTALLMGHAQSVDLKNSVSLVEEGKARAVILHAPAPEVGPGIRFQTSSVKEAAAELAATLEEMSGAKVPVVEVAPEQLSDELARLKQEQQLPVVLGALAVPLLDKDGAARLAATQNSSSFVLQVNPAGVAIAGTSPRAVEIGVYELLEQLGARWFFPGPLGTIIPQDKALRLALQETFQEPTFEARHFGFNALDREPFTVAWKKHQREGGPFLPPAHGIRLGADASFDKRPELYALVNGERTDRQICISNPEVLQRAIAQTKAYFTENPNEPWIGMGPKDGSGFCECDDCRKLDGGNWDPFSNEPSMTDRYVWFFNQVLDGIADTFPDKKIAFYVYHCYIEPPVKVTPNPKIVAAIAPIGLCRVHGMNNPVCPERSYLKGIIDAWTKILPEVYERGYWFNLADPGMTFVQVHRIRDEIPYYAKSGVKGFRTESINQWAAHGPSLYVAGKLMWDAGADPDALVKDYCAKLFGPAAKPMEQFFTYVDARLRDADHHTGSAFDLLEFYPPDVRKKARGYLNEAKKFAVTSPEKERVQLFDEAFSFTEAFAAMIEARNKQDWKAAHAALLEMDSLRLRLSGMNPPMLSPGQTESYLRRFFRLPVEQGYARISDGNQPVAFLNDTWESLLDPQQLGEKLHYERADLTGGNWQPTPTFTATWSDLGLRYYKGLAWYRQTVEIPKDFVGKRIFLWFGGVDESARVWVNGKMVGTSPSSAFTPFEVDVTEVVQPGKNVVALCVANLRTDELGTGGITAPAFFYAPVKGSEAELENIKPLRQTFP